MGGYLFPTNFLPRFFGPYAPFLDLLIIHLRKKFSWGGRMSLSAPFFAHHEFQPIPYVDFAPEKGHEFQPILYVD